MCNMSQSMRMSRQEYSLCKVRNTDNTERKVKNDLKSAWIYPRPLGSDAPRHSRRHRSKLHALQTCPSHLAPTIDLAHVPVNPSFRQASLDNLRCVHFHIFLDPSSFNTVYSEVWLSGFSVSSRCSWNHSRCSQPVNLNLCSRPLVNLNRCSRPVVSAGLQGHWHKSRSFETLNANLERPPAM